MIRSGDLKVLDKVEDSYRNQPPSLPDAAGWLVSTIDDYWAFARMMSTRGAHNAGRILAAATVEQMTTDRLSERQRLSARVFLGDESGWGLGLLAPAGGVAAHDIPGGFGWDGGTGTTWRSDPQGGVTGILFSQGAMTSPEPPESFVDFWECAYRGLAQH